MPIYSYRCQHCEETWDDFLPIDRRHEPEENPCPSCQAEFSVQKLIDNPKIAAGDGGFHGKVPDWMKDRLKDIHKKAGRHSKIDV